MYAATDDHRPPSRYPHAGTDASGKSEYFRPFTVEALSLLFALGGFLTMVGGLIDYIYTTQYNVGLFERPMLYVFALGWIYIVIAFYKGGKWEPVTGMALTGVLSITISTVFYLSFVARMGVYALASLVQMLAAWALYKGWNGSRSLAILAASAGTFTFFLTWFQLWLAYRKEVKHYLSNPANSRPPFQAARALRLAAKRAFDARGWQNAQRLYTEAMKKYEEARRNAVELGDRYVLERSMAESLECQHGAEQSQWIYCNEQDELTRRRIEDEAEVRRKEEEKEFLEQETRRKESLLQKARKCELACRFLDAIAAYTELGLEADAGRVRDGAVEAARKMEAAGKWEDAAVLYESLELWQEAGRARMAAHAAPAQVATRAGNMDNLEVMRDYDHFQGFVRVKVALRNPGPAVVTDSRLRLDFDADALRLDHVEPKAEVSGTEVAMGNVLPGQRKSIGLFFDPQVCGNTPLEGLVTYRHASGQLGSVPFKPLPIEVKCPLLFAPEQANTALVKNLMQETLLNRDAKIFTIPLDMDRTRAFCIARETITAHDVRAVSERDRGKDIEAWFYGQIKNTDERIVLRASVIGESVELFVAANSRTTITGLLAELGRNFAARMKEVGYRTVQITNIEIRDSIINRSTLLLDGGIDSLTVSGSVMNRCSFEEGPGPLPPYPGQREG